MRAQALLVVPDASRDPRFADNPLVTGPPFIRFYAGAPILTPEGHALGTVCVLDPVPRDGFDGTGALEALARQAAALIELRRLSARDAAARDALARELDRLWTLAHDLILLCDLDGRVIAANPAWTDVFGPLPDDEPVFMRQFLADPSLRPRLEGMADGSAMPVTLEYQGRDGRPRIITWTLRREGTMIYGIGRDDTALRVAERELVQAQRMESLGQLTGGIAHDFNNLLTIIIGNLDIARRRLATGDSPRVERALNEASEGAGRAATLTQRLLAFARRQRLAPRAIDPAALLAGMRPLVERAVTEAVTLRIETPAEMWAIEADAAQLESALLNLAVNARDAMAGMDAATLRLSAANIGVAEGEARRHGAAAGPHVRLTVADSGTGMPADVLERAFEPFFTTKGVGRGTGLGLSQVEGFVRQSGGFVTIDTAPGAGTAVHLWLPRSAAVPEAPAEEPAPRGSPVARGGCTACVMVAEDSDALRELIVGTLREAGYRVIEAHDGRSALSLFARQVPPPNLVLSDVMMPGLDGFQLIDEVRRRAPRTKVLLMSGYSGADRPRDPPVDVLLTKPFTPATLLERVREALAE